MMSSSRSFPTVKASISGALSNPFDQIFIDYSCYEMADQVGHDDT